MMEETPAASETSRSRFELSHLVRAGRVAAGLGAIALGLLVVPRPAGIAVAFAGLIPIAAGVFNVCPLGSGRAIPFLGSRSCSRPATPVSKEDTR
jgi:hypothetical protein